MPTEPDETDRREVERRGGDRRVADRRLSDRRGFSVTSRIFIWVGGVMLGGAALMGVLRVLDVV